MRRRFPAFSNILPLVWGSVHSYPYSFQKATFFSSFKKELSQYGLALWNQWTAFFTYPVNSEIYHSFRVIVSFCLDLDEIIPCSASHNLREMFRTSAETNNEGMHFCQRLNGPTAFYRIPKNCYRLQRNWFPNWRQVFVPIVLAVIPINSSKVIWCYQLSWWRKLATVKSFKADVSSVSPSSD